MASQCISESQNCSIFENFFVDFVHCCWYNCLYFVKFTFFGSIQFLVLEIFEFAVREALTRGVFFLISMVQVSSHAFILNMIAYSWNDPRLPLPIISLKLFRAKFAYTLALKFLQILSHTSRPSFIHSHPPFCFSNYTFP